MNTQTIKMTIFFMILANAWVFANITGKISGKILDDGSNEPLPGANIFIDGTFIGTSSDADGHFELKNLTPGNVIIKVSYIGFKSKSIPVAIEPNGTKNLEIRLQETTLITEQVVITGSRQPENLASAASSINVLDKAAIQRRNSFRADEALLSVPGITIVGENINIRGGSGYNRLGGSRTLVLLDEVPILTSDLGAANWNIIPVTEIEHIEVLKGAASSLYGSGALSGVVNIITKLPSRDHSISFRQSSGFYDDPSVPEWKWTNKLRYFNRSDLSYSKSFGPIGFRLAVSRHQSLGDRQNGRFERWYYTGKFLWHLPDQSTLSLFSSYSTDDRELFLQWAEQDHALQVPSPELGNRFKLNGYVTYLVYSKLFSPTLSTKTRISFNRQLVGIPVNISNAFTPALGLSGEFQANWKPHPDHSLSLGADFKHDEVKSHYYGQRSANGISPYIQEIWKVTNLLQFNAGLRWDTYTLVGDSMETDRKSTRLNSSHTT
jgi:outer membrane receptor protein involved in Fe transport